MADETKKKVRSVLEEHLGPAAARDISDQDRLQDVCKNMEWVDFAVGLETEFDLKFLDVVLRPSDSIDSISRLIDTILSSKNAHGH